MKINRIFWITAFLTTVLFVFLIFNRNEYHKEHQQQEVNKHAQIISESLWSFNPDLAKDYLQLVCKVNKYKTLVVMYSSNEEFISVNNALDNPIDLFFESLSLIRAMLLKSEISHDGIVIGEISVEWYNTAIYAYIYVFIVILLLLIVFWLFLSTLKHKYELKDRVRDRTADLKKEIEEYKRVENALQKSEEKFRSYVDYAPHGVFVADKNGNYVEVNSAACKITGYTSEELLSMNLIELCPRESLDIIEDHFKRVVNKGIASGESAFLRKEGSKGFWTIDAVKLSDDRFLSFVVDITERKLAEEALKESEKKYHDIFENSILGIYRSTLEGKYEEVNPAFANILGYNSPEEMIIDVEDISKLYVNSKDRERISDEFGKYGYITNYEIQGRHQSGKLIWISINGKQHMKSTGQVYYEGTVQDITESKLAEQELRKHRDHLEELVKERTAKLVKSQQSLALLLADVNESRAELDVSNKKLEASNKELEAFAYSVSHDLRAPLRAIDGFTGILMQDYVEKLDDEAKRFGSIIQKNSQKMGQLIDDLLAFSRLGRTSMRFSIIDMKDIVNAVYREVTEPVERKRISFTVADLPKANGDPNMLRQVWINIITNAIKFSAKQQQAIISITWQDDGKAITYCVKDNGAGFNMKYADKLFGVFQRLHSEKEYPGTGVGMALVKRIITRHGGKVWAEGEVDKGAAFYFSLPKK